MWAHGLFGREHVALQRRMPLSRICFGLISSPNLPRLDFDLNCFFRVGRTSIAPLEPPAFAAAQPYVQQNVGL